MQMRPAATAACNVYNNVTGNIAPGSVQIGAFCCLHSDILSTHSSAGLAKIRRLSSKLAFTALTYSCKCCRVPKHGMLEDV
jgi:hypothetical protein